jgi:hypothetical protein
VAFETLGRERVASVTVNGKLAATLRPPTRVDPWVEETLQGSQPPIAIVRLALPGRRQTGLLFVDGVCVDDGLTLEQWHAIRPGPIDDFEENIAASRWLTPPGAVVVGGAGFIGMMGRGTDLATFFAALAAFGIGFCWWLSVGRVVGWLAGKRSWPTRARSLLMLAFMFGIPLLAIGIFQQLSVGHL